MRLILYLILILPFSSFGQSLKVLVTDATTNVALPFANLYFKKAGIGVSTNTDGYAVFEEFTLQEGDSLLVSYIGYEEKAIPVSGVTLTSTLEVKLNSTSHQLQEVVVRYEEPPKPEKIIRSALKNTTANYSIQDVIFDALYRETIKEDDKFIQLNEAYLRTYYTGYPQKKLDREIWKDWFYDDVYAFDLEGDRFFHPLLKDFNTKKDQQSIVASRSSENLSKYGIETTLIGDPLLLLAFDKIKYQYDFCYPTLLKKYQFRHEDTEIVNGETCYVISFYPKSTERKFSIDQSRKNKSPIYIGRMYIAKASFALVKFQYRLAVERDYGFFANRIPLDYYVEMTYKKTGDVYFVDKIEFSETRKVGTQDNGASILHTATRSLNVINIEVEHATPFADTSLFKSTRFSAIRHYRNNYNPDFWNAPNLPNIFQLDAEIVSDLELNQPLSQQFSSFQKEEKKEMPAPALFKAYHSFDYHNAPLVDSLQWMALPAFEHELIKYLAEENKYALNELVEDKKYQRKLFDELNSFYATDEETKKEVKLETFYLGQDSLDHEVLYFQQDTTKKVRVIDLTEFRDTHESIFIKKITPNASKTRIAIQYEKLGVIGDDVSIKLFGDNTEVDSFSNVYKMEWISDSTLLYSKTGKAGRAGELIYRNVLSGIDSLLYHESDSTFDVEVIKRDSHIFCTVQSKTENEIFWVKMDSNKPNLQLVKARKSGVIHSLNILDGIYVLVNDENSGSSIQYADFENIEQFEQIATPNRKEYITDFLPFRDKIVALVSDNSIPKLKLFAKESQKWRELDLDLGIGQYHLYSTQKDTSGFTFSFSSPAKPPTVFRYNFESQQLTELSSIKTKGGPPYKYVSVERIWAKSNDGEEIPMTIFRNRAAQASHSGLLLKAYGAYGANTTPGFDAQEAILLQQGYTIVYAHVRGESILGADWYRQGRALNKRNSITDYLACAEHLLQKGIAKRESIIGYGNSAGGLIVAQAINLNPALFNTVILDHAYLDVINTMMNDTLPLTVDEYKEWGNPQDKMIYDYIMTYSPYQNITPQHYPNVLLTASYQDYQTPIWQIAKYAAKLRENNLSDSTILLLTDMNSGHMGNTTGKEWIKLFAQTYSFLHLKGE